MQLTAREDIEAPLDRVFAEITNFESIERQAMRRGVEVWRKDEIAGPAPGMEWHAGFGFRGKLRNATVKLVDYTPPERLKFESEVGGLEARTLLELVPLSRGRTRVSIVSDLVPKTLSARLLVQSLKLAKGGIDKRFRHRMAGFAKELENKLKTPY